MIVAESAFPLVKLRRRHPKIEENPVDLWNSVLLWNKRQILQNLLQIAEIGLNGHHLVAVYGQSLARIVQRPIILIQSRSAGPRR